MSLRPNGTYTVCRASGCLCYQVEKCAGLAMTDPRGLVLMYYLENDDIVEDEGEYL